MQYERTMFPQIILTPEISLFIIGRHPNCRRRPHFLKTFSSFSHQWILYSSECITHSTTIEGDIWKRTVEKSFIGRHPNWHWSFENTHWIKVSLVDVQTVTCHLKTQIGEKFHWSTSKLSLVSSLSFSGDSLFEMQYGQYLDKSVSVSFWKCFIRVLYWN